MPVDRKFFQEMIDAAGQERQALRLNWEKQGAVIAFCEMVLKKMAEEDDGRPREP